MENKPDNLWSLEAEAAVLGSMIIDRACIDKVLPVLIEDSFFTPEHKTIYAALLSLYTNNDPTDAVALRTELKKANQLDAVGGVEYIARLMESAPSSASAVYYAQVVRDKQRYRGLINTLGEMQGVIDEPGLSVDEQIQKIQDTALGLETGRPQTEFFTLEAEATKVAVAVRDHQKTIPTGFRNIDKIIGGIVPGELAILAGRPSMGKSALALNIALNMAKSGKSILFFTLEMPHQALIERAICNKAQVNMAAIKDGRASQSELNEVDKTAFELRKLDVVIHEKAATPEQQIAFIRAREKTHGVDVVFIDYLQLMNTGRRAENRVQEITTISRKLKLAAVQEQVPIIALSQLNRQVESREKHRPRLSDLRESGALEQDADIVMLLHREDYYRRNEAPGTKTIDGATELIIAKNRRGPTGIAELTFLEEHVGFGDLTREQEELCQSHAG